MPWGLTMEFIFLSLSIANAISVFLFRLWNEKTFFKAELSGFASGGFLRSGKFGQEN